MARPFAAFHLGFHVSLEVCILRVLFACSFRLFPTVFSRHGYLAVARAQSRICCPDSRAPQAKTKVPQSAPEKTAGQAASPLPSTRPPKVVDMVSSPLVASSLDVNAPPFYPSAMWYPSITDEYYLEHPHSPGKSGFVIADSVFTLQEIPDEELFDPTYYPMTADEMRELEQVDEINEMLAELEIMETHQELHHKISVKTRDLRSNSDVDAEIRSLMAKASKVNDYEVQAQKKKGYHSHHHNHHAKRSQHTPLHQPRPVK